MLSFGWVRYVSPGMCLNDLDSGLLHRGRDRGSVAPGMMIIYGGNPHHREPSPGWGGDTMGWGRFAWRRCTIYIYIYMYIYIHIDR